MEAQSVFGPPGTLPHLQRADADPVEVRVAIQQLELVRLVSVPQPHEDAGEHLYELRPERDHVVLDDGAAPTAPDQSADTRRRRGCQDVAGDVCTEILGGATVDADGEEDRVGIASERLGDVGGVEAVSLDDGDLVPQLSGEL